MSLRIDFEVLNSVDLIIVIVSEAQREAAREAGTERLRGEQALRAS